MYICADYPVIGCLSINHNVLLLYDACSGASASLLVRDYISPYCELDAQVLPWASGWGWGGPSRLSPVSMKVAMSLWQHTKISSLMMSKLGKGYCAFPAGLHGWALPRWMNPSLELMKLRWRGSGVGTTLTQAPLPAREDFFQFCYEPMSQSSELSNTCMNNQKDKLWSNASKS